MVDAAALTRAALTCSRDLAGLRDRALLLLVVATGALGRRRGVAPAGRPLTRQALLALTREQMRLVEAGLAIEGREGGLSPGPPIIVARARTDSSCPVRAMEDWLRASDTRFGPVFRKVDRWGNVEHHALAADALRRIVARRSGARRRRAGAGKQA